MIRKAKMDDVKPIHALLNVFADEGIILGRSISSLYDKLRDFIVYEDSEGNVAGVCALAIIWDDLAEIRSLAVVKSLQGEGVGAELVKSCLKEATDFGINQVFTLTYSPGFFRKLGFTDIDKKELPHKIWNDCLHCRKFPDCDEDALIFTSPT